MRRKLSTKIITHVMARNIKENMLIVVYINQRICEYMGN